MPYSSTISGSGFYIAHKQETKNKEKMEENKETRNKKRKETRRRRRRRRRRIERKTRSTTRKDEEANEYTWHLVLGGRHFARDTTDESSPSFFTCYTLHSSSNGRQDLPDAIPLGLLIKQYGGSDRRAGFMDGVSGLVLAPQAATPQPRHLLDAGLQTTDL